MAHCPHCKKRVTRWWWFAKVFGENEWTSRCKGCGLTCAIEITKSFTWSTKAWAMSAVCGLYLGVTGAFVSMIQNDRLQTIEHHLGTYLGLGGLGMLLFSFVAALVTDVRNSQVALTAAVVCYSCGERLPDDYNDEECPVCGEFL